MFLFMFHPRGFASKHRGWGWSCSHLLELLDIGVTDIPISPGKQTYLFLPFFTLIEYTNHS